MATTPQKSAVRAMSLTRSDDATRIAVTVEGHVSDEEHTEFAKDLADLVDLYFPTPKD